MKTARERAIDVLSEALVMDASEVNESTAVGLTQQWDSLAHMRLILALEDLLDRRLNPQEIVSIANLADVVAVVSESP